MNIKRFATKHAWIILVAILFTTQAKAQQVITLQEAIQQALKNKADAQKAMLEIDRASAKINEAKASGLPQINVAPQVTYNPLIQQSVIDFNGQQTVIKMGQPWTSNVAASLQQTIFDQRVFSGLKAAKSSREFYMINAELTNTQIIENVALAYYSVFVQEENLKTANESYTNIEKMRDVIKSLVDNGLAKPIDLDRTNVQLNNVAATQQTLINAVELTKNALKFYMGIPMDTEIELYDEKIEPNPQIILGEMDVNNRLEMKVLNKRKELLELNKKVTKASLYPSAYLQGIYGWYGTGEKFPWTNGKNNSVNWSDFANISLNINIPIFAGGANRARIQQAKLDVLSTDLDIKDTGLALEMDYKNAVSNLQNALINLGNMEENVALAEKVQNNTQSNYQYGLANLTDVLDSDNALTQAKQNYANALLDYKSSEIKLIKAKGELNQLAETTN